MVVLIKIVAYWDDVAVFDRALHLFLRLKVLNLEVLGSGLDSDVGFKQIEIRHITWTLNTVVESRIDKSFVINFDCCLKWIRIDLVTRRNNKAMGRSSLLRLASQNDRELNASTLSILDKQTFQLNEGTDRVFNLKQRCIHTWCQCHFLGRLIAA